MRNSAIDSVVTAAAMAVLSFGFASSAHAESEASMEASSMSSTSTASQSGGENNSQSSSSNVTQAANQNTSRAGGENSSQAGAEAVGGPLTNMKQVDRYNTRAGNGANAKGATPSSISTNPLNNGDAGNSVGNVVNGVPTGKTNVTNSGTTNSVKPKSSPDGNRQISDVSGAGSSTGAKSGKSIFAPHIVTRTYRWFRR